jgi:hypothetical protein
MRFPSFLCSEDNTGKLFFGGFLDKAKIRLFVLENEVIPLHPNAPTQHNDDIHEEIDIQL